MFGDGTLDCLEVDVIRCRSNALIHNSFPLPIASIIDLHDCADLYYIDAGEPLDDPFEALPGTEKWYWHEIAHHILGFRRSKEGRTNQSAIDFSFKASNRAEATCWQNLTQRLKLLLQQL